MHLLLVAAVAAVASARPSYIAVPADQIAFLDLSSLRVRRVPRQALSPPPPPQLPQALYDQDYQPIPLLHHYQQPANIAPPEPQRVVTLQQQPHGPDASGSPSLRASARLSERPPDFGEYVDFGAHTGDAGAFGWYADYPINNHEESSGYRK